ncbi:MAG: zinc ribbon domain-containing protein [Paludibacteraceae bacterium]
MNFKHFDLKEAQEKLFTFPVAKKGQVNRRKFIKAMSFSALTLNPVVSSMNEFDDVFNDSFRLFPSDGGFVVKRKNKTCWKYPAPQFTQEAQVNIHKIKSGYDLKMMNLRLNGSQQTFDVYVKIYEGIFGWRMKILIPQLSVDQDMKFSDWLDGKEFLRSRMNADLLFGNIDGQNFLHIKGDVNFKMDSHWNLYFQGDNAVNLTYSGKKHCSSVAILSSKGQIYKSCITAPSQVLKIRLPAFASMPEFMSDLSFSNNYSLTSLGNKPDVNVLIWNDKTGKYHQTIWINHEGEGLELKHEFQERYNFRFKRYFFLSEINDEQQPEVYLAAASSANQWFSNSIGAFLIGSGGSVPDLEAFGQGTHLQTYRYAPKLTAFRPLIHRALTLPTILDKPENIIIARSDNSGNNLPEGFAFATAADTTSKRSVQLKLKLNSRNISTKTSSTDKTRQKTTTTTNQTESQRIVLPDRQKKIITDKATETDTRKPQEKNKTGIRQPEISTNRSDILFKPNNLKFRILRPEDLLLLEFEFRNFIFSQKGDKNLVELQNKKNKGIIIVWIQTQHTLEEAFFEENEIPLEKGEEPSSTGVTLPAKHLRAYRSRLVFEYPAGSDSFPLNINELLDWSKFELRVDPRAWINVPQTLGRESIDKNPKYSKVSVIGKDKTVSINRKENLSYSLKLNQTNIHPADRVKLYDSSNVKDVFSGSVANSLLSKNIQKSLEPMLKQGPVPEDSTCIEAPALMYISPNQTGGFEHRITLPDIKQQGSNEIYEMWHTKLGVKLKDGKITDGLPYLRTIRALWAFDAKLDYKEVPNPNNPMPFLASLDANNRHILVHTTSNYGVQKNPTAVPVDKLMLTSLGAYLDWHAFFDVPKSADTYLDIIEWQHFATLGRDHFVKIVKEGYIFPFGHRAALVKITERKFMRENRSAVNRQRMYVVILQKEVVYDRNIPKGDFLKFPFQTVKIVNSNTPNIDNPLNRTLDKNINGYNFYIESVGKPFEFDVIFTDKEGAEHKKKIPLIFVSNIVARDTSNISKITNIYLQNSTYNNLNFNGDNVSFAESLIEGDTSYETREVKFGAVTFKSPGSGEICFRPTIQHALIKLEAVNKLTGNDDPVKIELVDDSNPGHVFASVENAVLDFSGGSDKSGGFLTPNMSITGLSRLFGTVGGDIADAMKMAFNVLKVFEALDNVISAKIFGVIDIFSLFDTDISNFSGSMDGFIKQLKAIQEKIEQLRNSIKLTEAQAVELEKNVLNNINYNQNQIQKETEKIRKDLEKEVENIKKDIVSEVSKLRDTLDKSIPRIPNLKTYLTDDAFHVQYKWQPDLGKQNKDVFPGLLSVKINEPKKALQIDTHFEKPFEPTAAPILNSVAKFENFKIEVSECIAVNFKSLKFESGTSGKSGVNVEMGSVPMEFIGALSFINDLNKYIPSSGFSDDGNGPYLQLTASGIKAGYTLALPNFEMGMCMITNVSLGAYINLPFTGDPLTIGFFFCTRENPFMLTISCFGGGGFIQLVTRLDGLESIEAAFEFGAAISLNVGVASGSVSVMGGIYYKSKNEQKTLPDNRVITYNQADLSAYLRINGNLSILGLIHVSLEFYLELHAVIAGGRVQKLEGSATLKVKVSVLFFSKTVSVTVRRTLAGSGGDPNFGQLINSEDWEQYCLAFSE